jgi:hypothetical protein
MKTVAADRRPSRRETTLSWIVIGLLLLIAAGIAVKQSRYDPGHWSAPGVPGTPAGGTPGPGGTPSVPDPEIFAPQGLSVLGPLETFGPENLSDKIDGKAELYLPAGFQQLACRRFVLEDHPDLWFEVFLYDMGDPRGAFSVYSLQRRSEAESRADLGPFFYRTANAVFGAHGKYYVELVASAEDASLLETLERFASRMVRELGQSASLLPELDYFPKEGLVPDSLTRIPADAFGFQEFQDVFTAVYREEGREATAFVMTRPSAAAAESLAQRYAEFLVESGAKEAEVPGDIPGARALEWYGIFEIVFSRGAVVAGVHEAEDLDLARRTARKLFENLERNAP